MSVITSIQDIPLIGDTFKHFFYSKKRKSFPTSFDGPNSEILTQIQNKGYYVLENYFSEDRCNECLKAFINISEQYPEYTKIREDIRIFGAENMCSSAMCFFSDAYLNALSDQYYGEPTHVGVMLANHVGRVEGAELGSGGDWHRDRFLRQFKALVYLDDVELDNGPFQVIEGSNTSNIENAKQDSLFLNADIYQTRFTDDTVQTLIAKKPKRLKTFNAKKGTVVLVDTSAIHRGKPLQKGERFAMFNYYYPQKNYNHEKMSKKFSPILPHNFNKNKHV